MKFLFTLISSRNTDKLFNVQYYLVNSSIVLEIGPLFELQQLTLYLLLLLEKYMIPSVKLAAFKLQNNLQS